MRRGLVSRLGTATSTENHLGRMGICSHSVERSWRNITAVRNVSDFKTVTSDRLIGTVLGEEMRTEVVVPT